jgi:hypothetical protein
MMKKIKASKSASDISLRKGATGAAATRSAFPTLRKKKTFSPPSKKAKGNTSDKPKKVKATRVKKETDSNIEDAVIVPNKTDSVKSERTNSPIGSSKPKAIAGPPKPKKNAGPKVKKDKTRTVFVAEPVVNLEEGADFGKTTHSITKTKQPVNPRQFR